MFRFQLILQSLLGILAFFQLRTELLFLLAQAGIGFVQLLLRLFESSLRILQLTACAGQFLFETCNAFLQFPTLRMHQFLAIRQLRLDLRELGFVFRFLRVQGLL